MEFAGKTAIVTGAGQGIGRALAVALAERGVRLLVNDLSSEYAGSVAAETGGVAHTGDLRKADVVEDMIRSANQSIGPVDMLFSNAGFASGEPNGPTSRDDAHWEDSWNLHVMAHLRAARLVLPDMTARGSGVLVNVASAAGVLTQIGDAAYSASKHAAVSLAQSLAIDHGDAGIRVSVVCPLYVATPLLGYDEGAVSEVPDGVITARAAAAAILEGVAAERFMIYPHPQAKVFFQRRAEDTDRWIAGMRRLRARILEEADGTDPASLHKHI